MVNKCIGFTNCSIYSNTVYITEYVKTLYYLTCCILLSFCLKRGYLEWFGRILSSPFTVPLYRRTWVESILVEWLQCWSVFPPENHTVPVSNYSSERLSDLHFFSTSQSKIHPNSSWLAFKENYNPTVFEHSKCVARFIHASQKLSCWLPFFDWMSLLNKWLNKNQLKQTRCVFLISYCLTTSNQREATSRTILAGKYNSCYTFWPIKNCGILVSLQACSRPLAWIIDCEVWEEVWIFRPFCCKVWKQSDAIFWGKIALVLQPFEKLIPPLSFY